MLSYTFIKLRDFPYDWFLYFLIYQIILYNYLIITFKRQNKKIIAEFKNMASFQRILKINPGYMLQKLTEECEQRVINCQKNKIYVISRDDIEIHSN